MRFKKMKEVLGIAVVLCMVSAFSIHSVKALATAPFQFVFDGSNGDIYCYAEAQRKTNDSSAYVYYYPTNDASVYMTVVGYNNGSYVQNIPLADQFFQPGQTGYIQNWIIESGLTWGCLRGEAATDYLYYGSGAWNINSQ